MAWNGSDGAAKPQKVAKKSKPSVFRGLLAAIIVICGAAGVYFMFLGPATGGGARDKAKAKPAKIAEAEPDIAPSVEPEEPQQPEKPLRFWEVDAAHTNGFTEMQMRKWRKEHMPPPGYTNNAVLTKPKPAYAIFNHSCENLIAAYLTLTPGEGMIGTPMLGERFRQQFLKSLEEPIIVTEDDSPEDAQLKRDMIATKIELKARMDEGEDICDIMSDTHREVQELARYKTMLQKEIRDASNNPEMTMEDVDDLIDAANMMLDAKGIAPITLGPISRRLIQRRKGF